MKPPIPQCGPCTNATHAVLGLNPQGGGGVLYWAQSLPEASNAADAFRANNFKNVRVMAEGPRREDATEAMILGMIQNDFYGDNP